MRKENMKMKMGRMVAVMTAAVIVLTGCSQVDEPGSAKVLTFVIAGGDTRATPTEVSLSDIWVFDYVGGELKQTVHQSSTDDGFGTVSLTAEYGAHTLYFVASAGRVPTVEGTVITWGKLGDTFWATNTLDVQPSTQSSQTVMLNRVMSRVRVAVADQVPTGLSTLRLTPSKWYTALDYMTGDASAENADAHDVSVPSSYIGTTGSLSVGMWVISKKADWTTNLRVQALKSDETLMADITLANVPVKRNRVTNISGQLFGASTPLGITVNTTWDDDIEVTW